MSGILNTELINVFVSILIAGSIGAALIFFFMGVGEYAALDERIFPRITGRQRAFFAFAGFYLLFLSAIEVLNPISLETMKTSLGLTFKPGFLGYHVIPDVSVQDVISLVWLTGLVIWFYVETKRYSQRSFPKTRPAPPLDQHNKVEDFAGEMRKRTKGLSFAFNFSALSFIIALIAPALVSSWTSNLGLIAILGVFLISGIYCFIEAIKLGAFFSGRTQQRFKNWSWVFFRVIGPALLRYLVVGIFGYAFYAVLPQYFSTSESYRNADLLGLVRSITKVVAGVFVILAAYLVGWGTDGLVQRIVKFMVTVALLPLILPLWEMLWNILMVGIFNFPSLDPTNPANAGIIGYTCLILALPVIAFRYGDQTRTTRGPRIAYIQDISWTPFFMSGKTNKYECKGYSSPEELLEDVVGQTARIGRKSLIPLSLRYQIGGIAGLHEDFDAVVLDVVSALRLIDLVSQPSWLVGHRSQAGRFFIVAGICRTRDVCLKGNKKSSGKHPIVAYSGAQYLPQNKKLVNLLTKGVKSLTGIKKTPIIEFLPPNCSSDLLSQPYDYLILPEPFATDFKMKSTKLGKPVKVINVKSDNEFSWLIDRYYVLLLRDISNIELVKDLCDAVMSGVGQLKRAKGPAAVGHANLLGLAAELDPGDSSELDSLSPALSFDSLSVDNVAIIDQSHPKGKTNWSYIKDRLQHLGSAGLITVTEEQLRDICNFSTISRYFE